MKKTLALLLVLLLLPLAAAGAEPPPGAPLLAGFGVVDLTPGKPVPLGGYAERKGALCTGVHDPVMARAVVLRQGNETVGVVSVDLVGVSARLRQEVERGLPLDALLVAATHTHSGPGGLSDVPLWRPSLGPHDPDLERETISRVRRAVETALADLKPARIVSGAVEVPGLQRGRTGADAPIDPSLGVMAIEGEDGRIRGSILHFAAHPTILGADNLQMSADWPGALCAAVEREVGGTALFLNGAMGDVSPVVPPEVTSGDPFARVRGYGEALAKHAAAEIARLRGKGTGDDALGASTRIVPGRTVAGALLGRPAASALASDGTYDLPVTEVRIGGLTLVTVAGEPVAAVGRAMGAGPNRWVVSCAQDHVGYFADRDLFRRGAYEADLTLFGPEVVSQLVGDPRAEPETEPQPPAPSPGRPVPLVPRGAGAFGLGVRHGQTLAAAIRDLLAAAEASFQKDLLSRGAGLLLLPMVQATGLPAKDLLVPAMVLAARRLQKHAPPDLLDEMEGVARGAGVPYDAILLENVFLTLAEQTNPAALLRMPAHCTNVVALGEATSVGQVIHGSTLDWGMKDVLKDRTVVLVMEPTEGHPFVSVTWPGMVGTLRAMGAQGIAITEESCAAPEDTGTDGMPIGLLMRRVVQRAGDVDEAVRMLRETPGTCGYKVTVSDGTRLTARVVEVTARRSHVREPRGGLLFGCDPESPCVDGACDPTIPRNDGSSARRYPVVVRLLEKLRGRIRTSLLSEALAATEGGVLNDGTLLACVFEPSTLAFHTALGEDVDAEAGRLAWVSDNLLAHLSEAGRRRYERPRPVTEVGKVQASERSLPLGGTRLFDVVMDSPVRTGQPAADRIVGQLFLPKDAIGVVVLMPPWKVNSLAGERLTALTFAAKGIATFVLPLPGQADRRPDGFGNGEWVLSDNLARTRVALLQGAEDAARVSRWLEEAHGFPPERQGVMGVSLGGHVAAIACGAYPDRFRSGAFILAGAHVERTFLEDNGTTDRIRRRLLARGVTPEEARCEVGACDPGTYGNPDNRDGVLIIAGDADPVVPPESARALAEAWGGARIAWLPGDHYAILTHLGEVYEQVTEHFARAFGPR